MAMGSLKARRRSRMAFSAMRMPLSCLSAWTQSVLNCLREVIVVFFAGMEIVLPKLELTLVASKADLHFCCGHSFVLALD